MKEDRPNFFLSQFPPKIWRFNLLWLGGWSAILGFTHWYFWFFKLEKSLSIHFYLLPFYLFWFNLCLYPLVKKVSEAYRKINYLSSVAVINGFSALWFSFNHPSSSMVFFVSITLFLGFFPITGFIPLRKA